MDAEQLAREYIIECKQPPHELDMAQLVLFQKIILNQDLEGEIKHSDILKQKIELEGRLQLIAANKLKKYSDATDL